MPYSVNAYGNDPPQFTIDNSALPSLLPRSVNDRYPSCWYDAHSLALRLRLLGVRLFKSHLHFSSVLGVPILTPRLDLSLIIPRFCRCAKQTGTTARKASHFSSLVLKMKRIFYFFIVIQIDLRDRSFCQRCNCNDFEGLRSRVSRNPNIRIGNDIIPNGHAR